MTRFFTLILIFAAAIFVSAYPAFGQTSAFTYQGKLTDASLPPTAQYDFIFRLFNSSGTQLGSDLARDDVQVTNGIFTVSLDFGSANFVSGAAASIEMAIRPGTSTGAYTTLTPRQPLMSSPYAIKSANADNAAQLGGAPASQYVQTTDLRLNNATISFNVTSFGLSAWTVGDPSDYQSGNNQNPTLILMRGVTYKFNLSAPGHIFRIAGNPGTHSGPAYTVGVTNNDISTGTLTFKVPMDAPDTLEYYCILHPFSMFGVIKILSPTAGPAFASGAPGNAELDALRQKIKEQQMLIEKLRPLACGQNPKAEPCVSEMPRSPHMH